MPPAALPSPTRRALLAFAAFVAALFLFVNRPAYQSFFAEDDLDNMANARGLKAPDIAYTLARPGVSGEGNFRVGAEIYYWALVRVAGLNYWPYIAGIHAIHLLNVLLIWLLARALGAEIAGACAAALLYAFHAAAFDIYWKSMYIFDLLCATYAIAALLAYVRGRILLSIVLFWLALRSKEVVIFFPVVLAAYEWLLGEGKWKRLVPFFAISLIVGLQGAAANLHRSGDYAFRIRAAAQWQAASFYAGKLLVLPFAGFAVLLVPFVARSRRVWFGVIVFVVLLAPMLFFPGRLFAAYLYVPLDRKSVV